MINLKSMEALSAMTRHFGAQRKYARGYIVVDKGVDKTGEVHMKAQCFECQTFQQEYEILWNVITRKVLTRIRNIDQQPRGPTFTC